LTSFGGAEPRFLLPFSRNKSIVPREGVFRSVNEKLPLDMEDQSAALYGLGGSGKTQAALEFAYQRRDHGYSVFWVGNPSIDLLLGCH
jgi:hypothetical protein